MLICQSVGSHELSAPMSTPQLIQSIDAMQFQSETQQDMLSVETNR